MRIIYRIDVREKGVGGGSSENTPSKQTISRKEACVSHGETDVYTYLCVYILINVCVYVIERDSRCIDTVVWFSSDSSTMHVEWRVSDARHDHTASRLTY